MEKTIYPTQKTYSKTLLWLQRVAGLVFLYATLTLPKGLRLTETPLVTTLRGEYPTWWHVLLDVAITLGVLALLLFLSKLLLYYTKTHRVSKKYIRWMQKVENRFLHNFLNFDFFLVKFCLATLASVLIWLAIKPVLPFVYNGFHVPSYETQPVVTVMVMLGLIVFVESFQTWKWYMRKFVHIREKL